MRSSRWRRATEASAPSAATTRPSSPATASASGVPASGRGSSTTSATPTAAWPRSQGSRLATRVRVRELDPARVDDRGREGAGQVAGRRGERLGPRLDRGRRGRDAGRRRPPGPPRRRRTTTSKSIDSWSEPGSTGAPPRPRTRPRPPRPVPPGSRPRGARASRRPRPRAAPRRAAAGGRSASGTRTRGTAGRRSRGRTPPPARGSGRAHVHVAHQPHQLAALEHGLAVLLERRAQLLGGDLVDVLRTARRACPTSRSASTPSSRPRPGCPGCCRWGRP